MRQPADVGHVLVGTTSDNGPPHGPSDEINPKTVQATLRLEPVAAVTSRERLAGATPLWGTARLSVIGFAHPRLDFAGVLYLLGDIM